MIFAVDSNVLIALWVGTAEASAAATVLLSDAASQGPLLISPAVYAELVAAPDRDVAFVDSFLLDAYVGVDWHITEEIWRLSARAFREYVGRRRTQAIGPAPRQILADFIIGAHAQLSSATLLTFDEHLYRASFPSLVILSGK